MNPSHRLERGKSGGTKRPKSGPKGKIEDQRLLWARELSIENSGLLQGTLGRSREAMSLSIISAAYCAGVKHAFSAAC
jgi:hypothetical protein